MKKPPSASVSPPIQTTQRVPMRSSKPGPAAGSGGRGGGASTTVAPGAAVGSSATAVAGSATAGAVGGSATAFGDGAVEACVVSGTDVAGGPTGLASDFIASMASNRARSSSAWLNALRATTNATMATINAKNSNITPPGDRQHGGPAAGLCRHQADEFGRGGLQLSECAFARQKFKRDRPKAR